MSTRGLLFQVDRDANSEKTITFSAGDEFMDMTQSHTVNIARDSYLHTTQPVPGPSNTTGMETQRLFWILDVGQIIFDLYVLHRICKCIFPLIFK